MKAATGTGRIAASRSSAASRCSCRSAYLEELWAFGLERFGSNGIQTNGTLINDRHIRLFKQYKVNVGISVDGPGELNDVRWAGTLALTREATANTHAAIERLVREGLTPSLIVTLHRSNATADKLPRMRDWFRYLDMLGITAPGCTILEIESPAHRREVRADGRRERGRVPGFRRAEPELRAAAVRRLRRYSQDAARPGRAPPPVSGMPAIPYTTRAVQGVEGHGQRSNCGRTNKDGIDFVKADREGLRALPGAVSRTAGGRRLPGLPLLPDVQRPVPRRRDRRRLAQPIEQVRLVDGPVRAFRGGAHRGRTGTPSR